jgi:L-threonylcarbamoyladenylate synthase
MMSASILDVVLMEQRETAAPTPLYDKCLVVARRRTWNTCKKEALQWRAISNAASAVRSHERGCIYQIGRLVRVTAADMPSRIAAAADALRMGGVVAYPTEAVYGFGCDPFNRDAFDRLFALKERPPTQGVLLIASDFEQITDYIADGVAPEAIARARATWPGPHTWVFPRSDEVPDWVAGSHAGIALRVTAHPIAAALCRRFGGAIVSTSANRHGEPAATTSTEVRAAFGAQLAYILDGALGGLDKPTPIRDAISGDVIRA